MPALGRWRTACWLLAALLVAVAVGVLWLAVEPMRISSDSMAPTYRHGDEVLVRKAFRGDPEVERGSVVVFRPPGSDALVVKRVAGMAGGQVEIRDGVLFVNDEPVPEGYVDPARVDGTWFGPVTVVEGSVFVLGDNRSDSIDSRDYGAVPLDRVVGTVRTRLWR
ncbi:signal peptidase I [Marmoricola sp. RAF53]|uniref:signal peptidase I n=1 Tax=Marmoricola sp. RAF53 TaxID=3233059 RepID=UPI003F95B546